MGIKVYGSDYPITPNVMRVLAAVYEKELEFDYVPLDMKSGAHKQMPYLSLNPFGQVPALEDGDIKLFESRAITRYIANEYENKGTQLLTKDTKKMALVEVWVEVEALHFDPVAIKLGWELVYKKIFDMEPDMAVVEENKAKLAKVLDVFEARLTQLKYLAGEAFSLADLNHLPIVHYLMNSQVKQLFEERPNVSAWCKDILSRPSWIKVVTLHEKLKG
ncbi:glutathione S-transferase-like [Chenopodium quinoa]|uniref:glutathione transferase n=1 Tax=Chenopodium quinoa TaxID=63459 RepID=A0A803L9S1_CHEQI|nr:glutathione S-transferase-like [Chenopodium quinoa]